MDDGKADLVDVAIALGSKPHMIQPDCDLNQGYRASEKDDEKSGISDSS